MGVAEWVALALGVLKFPEQVRSLILLLQDTPQELHEKLVAKIRAEAESFKKTGRPSA